MSGTPGGAYNVCLRKKSSVGQAMEERKQYTLADREVQEEIRRARRLQFAVSLAMSLISQGNLTVEEACGLVATTKQVALRLFPDKEATFDLIYKPKLQRLLIERYRLA